MGGYTIEVKTCHLRTCIGLAKLLQGWRPACKIRLCDGGGTKGGICLAQVKYPILLSRDLGMSTQPYVS